MDADEAIRMLGIIIAPLLNWDKQFIAMKDWIRCVIYKLWNTNIPKPLTYIFSNAYLIKSVYFEYGVMSININQEEEL